MFLVYFSVVANQQNIWIYRTEKKMEKGKTIFDFYEMWYWEINQGGQHKQALKCNRTHSQRSIGYASVNPGLKEPR